jgi:hypothetical protein
VKMDLSKLKFSKEPVVYIGLLAAVAQLVYGLLTTNGLSHTIVQPFLTAVATVISRGVVTPTTKGSDSDA